jgi:hypothetical protein
MIYILDYLFEILPANSCLLILISKKMWQDKVLGDIGLGGQGEQSCQLGDAGDRCQGGARGLRRHQPQLGRGPLEIAHAGRIQQ